MFKKTIVSSVLGLLLFAPLAFAKQPITLQDIAKSVPFPMEGVKIVSETPIGNGVYQVTLSLPKSQRIPYAILYATKNYAIAGNLFQNKQNKTLMAMNQLLQPVIANKIKESGNYAKTHISELNAVSVASFEPKNANGKILFMFTDTQCPACQIAKKGLITLAEKTGYTIKIIPLAMHPESIEYWNGFICGHKTFKDYVDGNYKPMKECQSTMNYVGNASQLAQKMGIFATPTFITNSGKVIVGDNSKELENLK